MGLFFLRLFAHNRRNHQERDKRPQPKNEPLVYHPVDTSYCRCGCETILCTHCWCVYCPRCHAHHVLRESNHETFWACDSFQTRRG